MINETEKEVLILPQRRIYNFSAGPSVMPEAVLKKAQAEMLDYNATGMSVMEMSHRSKAFAEIFAETKAKLRAALGVPDTHEILFLQGGATLQFAAVPMNLMGENGAADYAVTGNFSSIAAKEAAKYGRVNISCDTSDSGHDHIPEQSKLKLSESAGYFYYCSNNTVYGTEWQYTPETYGKPLACDMSSDILSRPVNVSDYGLIFAGAQKNMAPAGLTVVIIDKSLAGKQLPFCPEVMSYETQIKKGSMLNTPPCWCIYMLGLMLDWLNGFGGVSEMEKFKRERAARLYEVLDNSRIFLAHAKAGSRSDMNITFRTHSPELDAEFLKGAEDCGLVNLKGHRITGGMRASMYNAMPMEGVSALIDYMKKFEVTHNV